MPWPTPGSSTAAVMPCSARCAAGPMPESISSCGLLIAPPAEQHLAPRVDRVLAAAVAEGQAGGPAARQLDPRGQGVGEHGEVGAVHRRLEVGVVRRAAHAAALGDLVEPEALLLGAVEVVGALVARGHGALDEGVRQVVGPAAVLDAERAVGAVEGPGEPAVGLRAPEVGQHVVVAPALGAVAVAPGVVVGAVAADVDHRVHRRAAAQRLHPRPGGAAPVQLLLRGGLVVPVPLGLGQRGQRRGDGDLVDVRGRAGLQQQHAGAGVVGQAGGQDGPCAAGSDDDVVVGVLGHEGTVPLSASP